MLKLDVKTSMLVGTLLALTVQTRQNRLSLRRLSPEVRKLERAYSEVAALRLRYQGHAHTYSGQSNEPRRTEGPVERRSDFHG